jgi:hypothetical protein
MPSKNWKFIKNGLPFFALVIGSTIGLTYFQQVKFDYSEAKHRKVALSELV